MSFIVWVDKVDLLNSFARFGAAPGEEVALPIPAGPYDVYATSGGKAFGKLCQCSGAGQPSSKPWAEIAEGETVEVEIALACVTGIED